uniref:UDP-glucose 4-epimerase n=1 Tax=Pseudomonas aeruginosa TaxID=287 RepID=A0A7S5YC37_PSEAI|nr:UDP-glucose 4-epimerase [Pseudomonas aeruginosa]QLG05311.1 UDP-glucose 4-epimerase [Pseudomonas aeruginosa]
MPGQMRADWVAGWRGIRTLGFEFQEASHTTEIQQHVG